MMSLRILFLACGLVGAAVAASAEPRMSVAEPGKSAQSLRAPAKSGDFAPMKVSIVRSAAPGCEPDCPEWIAAQGMIGPDTMAKFRKALAVAGMRKLPLLIDSGGGVVDDSLAIGRLIRAKGLDVVVAKTSVQVCAEGDRFCKDDAAHGLVRGVPVARLAKCASSCAFLLAAGKRRVVGATAFVGVHQLKTLKTTAQIEQKFRIDRHSVWGIPTETRRTLISERIVNRRTSEAKTPESAYAKVAAYFKDMGVEAPIMPILRSTPNNSIRWLTRAELKDTRIATDTEAEVAFRISGRP